MFKFFTVAVCQTPAVLTRSWGVKRFGQLSLLMWARGAQAEWTLELGQALARKGASARTLTCSKEVNSANSLTLAVSTQKGIGKVNVLTGLFP